nr:flagellar biosynthesis protein FlhA [Helicobacter sp. MIT 14-3879]
MAKRSQVVGYITPFVKRFFASKDLIVVVFIMAILAIIIVPLPSYLLDFFLTISISLSVLILLISLYIGKPTDFSAFPTLLLMVTLFRLALNVATTRMILSNGHLGVSEVSEIVGAFGNFVVGGNYVIGIIVFAILIIVNYLVITNGSTRVAEVQARFTLEAMPGKQMAIDADLNSGLIEKEEAQRRREILTQEADFYGSMDGASKFVKGDAIAGIIITFINIIGGFLIGVFGNDMSLSDSASTFTILTIGDGLVSQVPALIVSTATGIVITRATKGEESNFASKIVNQLLGNSKILAIVGAILLFFALIPGLPTLSLGFVGSIFLLMSYLLNVGSENIFNKKLFAKKPEAKIKQTPQDVPKELRSLKSIREQEEQIEMKHQAMLDEKLKINVLQLSVGYALMRLTEYPDSSLIERIRGVRANIAQSYGFIIPKIRIIVNPSADFSPNGYEFFLKGIKIGGGEVMPDRYLAMDPTGMAIKDIEGVHTKEPVYNTDALWVDKHNKDEATMAGYSVVDPSTVISTHINELIKYYAEEILTRQDVRNLIDRLKDDFPSLVNDVNQIPLGIIHQVLKELLHDKIPIKDMITILETIIEVAPKTQNNVSIIMDYVRSALSRVITDVFKNDDGSIKFFTLPAESESYLLNKLQDTQYGRNFILSIGDVQTLINSLNLAIEKSREMHIVPILLVETNIRSALTKVVERNNIPMTILGNAEISPNVKFEFLGNIDLKFN